ncbi:hypothetical protein C9I94_02595 [Photobacterium swingsii]|uniref:Uncharacterized protein n=2 Tax=Photobacterium swingsii TaxID=680026 RepID=A0A2T3PCG1_9GAMM|nr:hypothetical protein C9I94_02595 [Photobacterium swingsii]
MIIGYVDGENNFYGRVFYGGQLAWEIPSIPVPTKVQKGLLLNNAINRSPVDLQPIKENHQLGAPSLSSPIPSKESFYLQLAEITFFASFDSYDKIFKKKLNSAIGGMDYAANLLDYVFARDALIRFSYAGGLIATAKPSGLSENEQQQHLRTKLDKKFSLFHRFTGPANSGANTGLTSWCEYNKSLWCTLHEVGHAFNLGHDIGPESVGLMGAMELIPTNNISVVKSSPGAMNGKIVPAMQSRMSPNANIDHLDVERDGRGQVNVFANDFDANGNLSGGKVMIRAFDQRSAQNARIAHLGNGVFEYVAPVGFVGEDEFSYVIVDDQGMADRSEVHVRVLSKSRIAYYSLDNYTVRKNLKTEDNKAAGDIHLLVNQAGGEHFIRRVTNLPRWSYVGLAQEILREGGYNLVFEENDVMANKDHVPHDLVPGLSSYSVSLTFTQDGDFVSHRADGSMSRGSQEIAMVGQGKLDEGFALSYFNGNTQRANHSGEPLKGLGWTLVGRQFFTQSHFRQQPHIVHAYAKPDAVVVNDNKPHKIVWVVNRENNTVTTWVDNKIVPMKLAKSDTDFSDHVTLPDGFAGVYPGGTHGWYSSGRDWYSQYVGPWFMRQLNAGDTTIWEDVTDFVSHKSRVDDIQLYSYALNEQEVRDFYEGKQKAYSNAPLNGKSTSWQDLTLRWNNKGVKGYRLTWGYQADLTVFEQQRDMGMATTVQILPDRQRPVLYWRIDTQFADGWVNGNIWSVVNPEKQGKRLTLSFTQDELDSSDKVDSRAWPMNVSKLIEGVQVTVTGQHHRNEPSQLILRGHGTALSVTSHGELFSQAVVRLGSEDAYKQGHFKIQYRDGANWVDGLVLYKNGVATSFNINGDFSRKPGVANGNGRGSGRDRYKATDTEYYQSYSVVFPSGTNEVRFVTEGKPGTAVVLDYLELFSQ